MDPDVDIWAGYNELLFMYRWNKFGCEFVQKYILFSFLGCQVSFGVGIGTCCGNDSGNCVRYVDLDFTGVKSRRLMASRWSWWFQDDHDGWWHQDGHDGFKMIMMVTKITAIAHNSVKQGHRSQKVCIQANFEVLNWSLRFLVFEIWLWI